ncbi:MAG: glycosyltransferase family 1 protein [Ardenticatenia bacterium]|nr:MAG: glycosyltransferase family 1 protein [Ardenticatenia bacterium]
MRIGIDASRAVRLERTGTELYSYHLIRALLRVPQEHHVILYAPRDLPADILPETRAGQSKISQIGLSDTDAKRWTVRIIPFPRLWTHVRLNWELRCHPPDLLFIPAHVMPLACPVPTVVTVHDLGYRYYPEAHRAFDRWYLDWSTRRHVRLAAYIVADSEATRHDLAYHYGADLARVRVIYPGYDETLRRVEDAQIIADTKARYHIAGDYLLYLGTLQPRKNLSRLIEAFARAGLSWRPSGQQDLQLVLAGQKGWDYDALVRLVNRMGLQNRVLFPGYVAPEDKAALLSGAKALVFPSLYEGFGMPVLEAMVCGVPVVTSRVSSLPEVAGDAAVLVDPLDVDSIAAGLSQVLCQPDLCRMLVERGYRQAQRFSWQNAARQLWEVFDSARR